jgi:hypothetical protein
MAEIRHRVGIAATPAAVFGALSTTDGISECRVRDLDGDPFPRPDADLRHPDAGRDLALASTSDNPSLERPYQPMPVAA